MRTRHAVKATGFATSVRRGALAAVFLLLVALSVAGCGSSGGSSGGTEAKLQETTPAAKGELEKLSWGLPTGEPETLDPPKAVNLNSSMVVANLCDPLLRVEPDFSLKPNLARLSRPNRTTLVLNLVADAKFWDGKPVTAEDVQYSLERAGNEEVSYVAFLFSQVKSVDVTGSRQVTIRLKAPDALLAKELGGAPIAIYEKAFAEKAGESFGTPEGGIMCSGPFKLKSWVPGSKIELERNNDYWNSEWRPHAASAELQFVTDSNALSQALNAGELDGAYEVPPAVVPSLDGSSAGRLLYGPCDCWLSANVTRPDGPLADLAVRKALFKSIDRAALAESIYHGFATPNYTLLAKSVWPKETEAQWAKAYTQYEQTNAFDPTAAKEIVENSSYEGQPIVLATLAGDETQAQVAQVIQQEGKEIGLNVKIRPLQAVKYAETAIDPSARAELDLIMYASYNQYPDPLETIPFYVVPGVFDYTEYEDPKVTQLLTEAKEAPTPQETTSLLIQAQKIYEPNYVMQAMLNTPEISFLNSELTGAVTSFAYVNEPSLALIGKK